MNAGRPIVAMGVCAVLAAAAFVILDRSGGSTRFADLPGDADIRLVGSFTPAQLSTLAALPQSAAVECATTLYGVATVSPRKVFPDVTVLTATRHPQLRWSTLESGRYPAGDEQALLDEKTAERYGLRIGDRLTLSKGTRQTAATIVGVAVRPADRAVGTDEPVVLLPSGAVAALAGGGPCPEVAIALRRRSDASGFRRALTAALGRAPSVTYDDSLRGHV